MLVSKYTIHNEGNVSRRVRGVGKILAGKKAPLTKEQYDTLKIDTALHLLSLKVMPEYVKPKKEKTKNKKEGK